MEPTGQPILFTGRIHALDALRATVMILGVFLHGAAAYMRIPLEGLLWPVIDPSTGWGFDLVVWYLHGFRIPLFFLVAGFFAAVLRHNRGVDGFMLHRLKRIGAPLLGATLIILPISYLIWGLGLVDQGLVTWRELLRLSFRDAALKYDLLGMGHLWFLQYLLLYSLAYFLLLRWCPTLIRTLLPGPLLRIWWGPLLLVGVSFCFLAVRPEIYVHFDNRWFPEPLNLAYHSVFFVTGTLVYRVREEMMNLVSTWWLYLAASFIFFAVTFMLLQLRMSNAALSSYTDWAFALAVAAYSWSAVWGFLGLFLFWSRKISANARFLSDAAYWIYLIHLPVVGLLQLLIQYLGERFAIAPPPVLAFVLSVGCTLAFALFSYRYFVRYGVIGRWLNGPRQRPGANTPHQPTT